MAAHDSQLDICLEKWKQFDQHTKESIGVRDRLMKAEMAIERLKVDVKKNAIIGGIIGALLGNASPELIKAIVSFVTKGGI